MAAPPNPPPPSAAPLTRRTFLTALGAGSAAVVVSCSGDGDSTGSGTTAARRRATTTVAIPDVNLAADPFGLGVASGDPLPDSVILWTRLVGDLPEGAIDLKWEIATDEGFATVVGEGIATAEAEWAHSVHLDVRDLEPATEYWYRFSVGDFTSAVGRTRTTPADDDTPDELRIGFASCQHYPNGYYTAHRAMAADRLDLVLFLGDYIYESASSPTSTRQVPGGETVTLDDYRLRYATYTSDEDLRACRASAPWVVTWDDHEVENNYASLADQNDQVDDETFAARRAAAYQAYYEHMPVRLDPPDGHDWRIHRTVRAGRLAEFFVLDGRQYRTDQACNDSDDAIVPAASCPELGDESRTMLGTEQESWLSDGLRDSPATWKVLAQQTVMSSLVLGDIVLNVDQWDGYPAARERLLRHLADHDISDVVVLTGDIHSAGAGDLAVVDEAGGRTPVAVEFVGTSITSSSLVDIVPGGADLVTPDKFPGIAYLNVRDHGYGRCTITPDEWRTEFVVVETITDPANGASRVDATCVTPAGTPSVSLV